MIQTIVPRGDILALDKAEAQVCKADLRYLCQTVLGFKDWDACHDDLARFLRESNKRFKLILVPREHLKTSVVTVGKAIQHILCDPNVSILYASAVLDNSKAFLSETREYLEKKSDLPKIFGEFKSEVWNTERITVAQRITADKQATIETAGADQTVTSKHYDIIFADDLVNRQTINTPEQIGKTRKFYSDLFDLLKKPNGIMYIIGTRWDDKDLYGQIIRDEDELEKSGRERTFDIHVRKAVENGQIIFPKKFSFNILADLKQKKGSYEFSCQYNNEPIAREDQQFKPPVRYWQTLPPVGTKLITVDLAPGLVPGIQENPDGDNNCITSTIFSPSNQLYVAKYKYGRFPVTDTIEHLFNFVYEDDPWVVGIEANAYQRVFLHLLDLEMRRRNKFFTVYPIIQHRDKFTRLMSLQPLWERGDILLKPGMVELEEEFERFPRGMHDDVMDTLEMATHLFTGTTSTTLPPKPHDYLKEKDLGSYLAWENWDKERANKSASGFGKKMQQVGA